MKLSASNYMEMTWNKSQNLHTWVLHGKNNSSSADTFTRIAKALSSVGRLQSIWKDKEVSVTTKAKLLQTLVFPIICYTCET